MKKSLKASIAFVVEGQTESWYLQMLKRNERYVNVAMEPKLPLSQRLSKQYSQVKELAKEYTRVYWIIDFDVIKNQPVKKNKKSKTSLQKFVEYRLELSGYNNVIVIVNNPCLEFWFLLHFLKTGRQYSNCEEVIIELRKHLPEYDKNERFFVKDNNDIYKRLKPYLCNAISNAKSLGNFNPQEPLKAVCEMYRIFEDPEINKVLLNSMPHKSF